MSDTPEPKVVYYADGTPAPVDVLLNDAEARVLGALVEKQVTTPDYYPLTLNALLNACNQTSSREPVVSYEESTVLRALEGLRDQKLALTTTGGESRTPKYRHKLTERYDLSSAELALLCLLLLRGPQTVGELRTRSGRLHEFTSLAEVEDTLNALAAKTPQSLVTRLPRQPGYKESRFAHLLCGAIAANVPSAATAAESALTPTPVALPPIDRVGQLQQEVATLRQEIAELREQFATFRKQFE